MLSRASNIDHVPCSVREVIHDFFNKNHQLQAQGFLVSQEEYIEAIVKKLGVSSRDELPGHWRLWLDLEPLTSVGGLKVTVEKSDADEPQVSRYRFSIRTREEHRAISENIDRAQKEIEAARWDRIRSTSRKVNRVIGA